MAIVQISRIQHRRGLDQDLPNLSSAEFGWAVDTQKLYIGNGTLLEGAPVEGVSEILTEHTNLVDQIREYTFQGAETGYTSQTGPDVLNPVQRTLQDRLDDDVNIKNFGAAGDGVTDDTLAIQRALDQIYFGTFAYSTPQLRRIIKFPAGTYVITNSLKIPGYCILVGDGKDRTFIKQTDPNYPLAQLSDSFGQYGASYGIGGPSYPPRVLLEGMTLNQTRRDKNIVELNASTDVVFRRVRFLGNTDSSTDRAGIYGRSTVGVDIAHLTIDNCEFENCYKGIDVIANVSKITNSTFRSGYYGIYMDSTAANTSIRSVKITNNGFDGIYNQGIWLVNNATVQTSSITASNDFAANVGKQFGAVDRTELIRLQGIGVYSVGDIHTRSSAAPGPLQRPIITNGTGNVVIDNYEGITTGLATRGTGRSISLPASQTNANSGILLCSSMQNASRFNYTIVRPSSSAIRAGTITVNYNSTYSIMEYQDDYMEKPDNTSLAPPPGATGTILTPTVVGSNVWLYYTTTSSGFANVTYSTDSLDQLS
jgi:hypothetical protein